MYKEDHVGLHIGRLPVPNWDRLIMCSLMAKQPALPLALWCSLTLFWKAWIKENLDNRVLVLRCGNSGKGFTGTGLACCRLRPLSLPKYMRTTAAGKSITCQQGDLIKRINSSASHRVVLMGTDSSNQRNWLTTSFRNG